MAASGLATASARASSIGARRMLRRHGPPPSSGSPSPFPEVIAAIDIGTNSIHMVVARTAGNDRFEVITRLKEMVRLGSVRAR